MGDSYMRNFYAGVEQVLSHGEWSPELQRKKIVLDDFGLHTAGNDSGHEYHMTYHWKTHHITVRYTQMMGINLDLLSKAKIKGGKDTLVIFGSMVHDHKYRAVDRLIQEAIGTTTDVRKKRKLKGILKDKTKPAREEFRLHAHTLWMDKLPLVLQHYEDSTFVWVTSPAYDTKLLKQNTGNVEAALNQENGRYLRFNQEGVNLVLQHPGAHFFDAFHFTKACTYTNCSKDGAHRAPFVNRMKFQVVLNTICR